MGAIKRQLLAEDDRRRRATTLGDLVRADSGRPIDVFCWCNRCGHNAVVPTLELIARLGPDQAVPSVGAQLRCTGCGSKDVATRPAWRSLGPVARHSE